MDRLLVRCVIKVQRSPVAASADFALPEPLLALTELEFGRLKLVLVP